MYIRKTVSDTITIFPTLSLSQQNKVQYQSFKWWLVFSLMCGPSPTSVLAWGQRKRGGPYWWGYSIELDTERMVIQNPTYVNSSVLIIGMQSSKSSRLPLEKHTEIQVGWVQRDPPKRDCLHSPVEWLVYMYICPERWVGCPVSVWYHGATDLVDHSNLRNKAHLHTWRHQRWAIRN